jgi:hypothetical protein
MEVPTVTDEKTEVQNANPEKSNTLTRLEAIAAELTGQSVEDLRNQTISELRRKTESRVNHKICFGTRFPLIGRGSVMRDRIIDHQTVDAMIARILK